MNFTLATPFCDVLLKLVHCPGERSLQVDVIGRALVDQAAGGMGEDVEIRIVHGAQDMVEGGIGSDGHIGAVQIIVDGAGKSDDLQM